MHSQKEDSLSVNAPLAHDFVLKLPPRPRDDGVEHALRWVLLMVLDRSVAEACLSASHDDADCLWPSSLYGMLAAAALRSERTWFVCADALEVQLERTLGSAFARLEVASAMELARLFRDGRDTMPGDHLAAMIWLLLRRRRSTHDSIAIRMARELEVVAGRRMTK